MRYNTNSYTLCHSHRLNLLQFRSSLIRTSLFRQRPRELSQRSPRLSMLSRLLTARLPERVPRCDPLAHSSQLPDAERHAPRHLRPSVVPALRRVPLQDLLGLRKTGRLAREEARCVVGCCTRGFGRVEVGKEIANIRERMADGRHLPAMRYMLVGNEGTNEEKRTLEFQSLLVPSCEIPDYRSCNHRAPALPDPSAVIARS